MDTRFMRVVGILAIVVLMALAVIGVAGCSGDSADEGTDDPAEEVATEEAAGDTAAPDAEDAVDIAQAYFVAQTDFTSDQFAWAAEELVEADDGTWYARVTATPNDDGTLETEQVYVYKPTDSEAGFWFALDMGTGIDPMTDDRFPPEVQEALTP